MMKPEPERRDAKPENITAGVLSAPRFPKSESVPPDNSEKIAPTSKPEKIRKPEKIPPSSSSGLDALAAVLGEPVDAADREARQHVASARAGFDVDDSTAAAIVRKLATKIRDGTATYPAGLARTMLSEPPSPDEVARLLAPPKRTAEERRAAREREQRAARAASEGYEPKPPADPALLEEARRRREQAVRDAHRVVRPAAAPSTEAIDDDEPDDETAGPDEHAPAGDPRELEAARQRRERARREAHQAEAARVAAGHRPRLLP